MSEMSLEHLCTPDCKETVKDFQGHVKRIQAKYGTIRISRSIKSATDLSNMFKFMSCVLVSIKVSKKNQTFILPLLYELENQIVDK